MNVLITGANEGIGYYTVTELLSQGYTVSVLDIEITNLQDLQKRYPDNLLSLVCDIRKTESVANAVKQSFEKYGEIDIVIHNACVCTFQSIMETENSVFENIFDVNYFGAIRLIKSVIPCMSNGKIMLVSSGIGVTGFHNITPYASSKGALEALAKCLKIEYKDTGISFHLIHPPLTNTKSASPLPVPKEFMANPEKVGKGIAKNIHKKSFVICHSFGQKCQTMLCYLFPLKFGTLLSKMTKSYQMEN